jgi:hypothetical protein
LSSALFGIVAVGSLSGCSSGKSTLPSAVTTTPRAGLPATPTPRVRLSEIYRGTAATESFPQDVQREWQSVAHLAKLHLNARHDGTIDRETDFSLFPVPGSDKPAVRIALVVLPFEMFDKISYFKEMIANVLRASKDKTGGIYSIQVEIKVMGLDGQTDKFGHPVKDDPVMIYNPIYLAATVDKIQFETWDQTHAFEIADEPNKIPTINYDDDDADLKSIR